VRCKSSRAATAFLTIALTGGFVSLRARLVSAIDLRNVLEGYTVASWSRKDGLPTTHVRALAQDKDGYLWVGIDAGLHRFDGVEFVPWEILSSTRLPSTSVRMLFGSTDGSIWVGYAEPGGITRILPDGVVRNYGEADGLGVGRVYVSSVSEDRRGAIWAGRSDGLYRFADDRWERWSPGHGVGPAAVISTYVDARGTLVIGTTAGIFQLREGESAFERIHESDIPLRSIAADRFGRLWVSDAISGIRTVTEPPGSSQHGERSVGGQIVADRKGYLWLATIQGLWRVQPQPESGAAPIIEKVTASTGLLADGVSCLLEDREGNIWVGTSDGLNRLTPHKVKSRTDLGFASAIERTAAGIWVGSADELIHFPQSIPGSSVKRHRFDGTIATIHADAHGVIWVATSRGVFRVVPAGSEMSAARILALNRVSLITSDADGGIWLNDQDAGVVRWDGNRVLSIPDLPRPIQAMYGHTDGSVWVAGADGRLTVIARDRQVRVYGAQQGLVASGYTVIYESRDGVVWLGAPDGLTRFANGRFTTLRRSENFPLQSFRAIVEDDTGQVWIGTEAGIHCMGRAEIDRAVDDPVYPLKYRLYDLSDGLAGFPLAVAGNRRAIRAQDGQLWFVTHRGVTVIDPQARQQSLSLTPVYIERISVGDRQFRASSTIVLPPRTSRLQIEYAILNLTSPLKTRFRYRLEGFDADWIDASTRRQALYTNLPPRRYRFVVQADNNEGTWGPTAALDFSIAPVFYQTRWFASVCVVALAAAIGAAWRMRLRRVRKEFALILGERARLSREIHDTLLQSLVGIALQCDAIAGDVGTSHTTAKSQLLRMRRQVEDYIREARQSIWDLRSPTLQRLDLAEALRAAGERATADSPIQFEFTVSGAPHRCSPKVEEQLLRIGQEAVLNATRHAQASRVRMALRYEDGSVALQVSDDGRGFDPETIVDAANGHYGLTTMKERADALGAMLRIDSTRGAGTEIETVVPVGAGG
jgi:signal transduction histidine kinase/ligand-binding sensor domain-containing protein